MWTVTTTRKCVWARNRNRVLLKRKSEGSSSPDRNCTENFRIPHGPKTTENATKRPRKKLIFVQQPKDLSPALLEMLHMWFQTQTAIVFRTRICRYRHAKKVSLKEHELPRDPSSTSPETIAYTKWHLRIGQPQCDGKQLILHNTHHDNHNNGFTTNWGEFNLMRKELHYRTQNICQITLMFFAMTSWALKMIKGESENHGSGAGHL